MESPKCLYCHEDRDGYTFTLDKNGHAYISNPSTKPVLIFHAKGYRLEIPIDYCPRCGRRLRKD